MTTLLDAVLTEITTLVPTLVAGSTLFAARIPETPDRCVTVFEYDGVGASYVMGSGTTLDHPRIQVICRAGRDQYDVAAADALLIHAGLDVVAATWSGNTILRCEPLSTPSGVGTDESERPMISVRFEVVVSR